MILFTLDDRKALQKDLFIQLCFSAFCALFGAVYEYFSHEVYSYFMIYAFAIPLTLTVLPLAWILLKDKKCPLLTARMLWGFGTATLTVGCLFRGVLDIYGTTNRLVNIYPAASAILLGSGVLSQLTYKSRFTETGNDPDLEDQHDTVT